jgi:predicted patatin/cPLA2 family phospholipase
MQTVNLEKSGLVLEGGGLRGVYTSGVLRHFMDQNLYFPYVIGVSMGACNAANYVARQPERNRIVNIRYVNDSRYLSYRRLLLGGELFGMDFIFDTVPNQLVPFDYQTFARSPQEFIITATDCVSGQPVYYEKTQLGQDFLRVLRASASLPLISKPVEYGQRFLLDGGLSDSIPLKKCLADGNEKCVLVLTQARDYRKSPERLRHLTRWRYPQFKGLNQALATRHLRYNETIETINQLESQGRIFVIRPEQSLGIGRVERHPDKLHLAYDQGYADAQRSYPALCQYLS